MKTFYFFNISLMIFFLIWLYHETVTEPYIFNYMLYFNYCIIEFQFHVFAFTVSPFLEPSHLWCHFLWVYLSESFMKTATKKHNCLYIFVMRICVVFCNAEFASAHIILKEKVLYKWICAQTLTDISR